MERERLREKEREIVREIERQENWNCFFSLFLYITGREHKLNGMKRGMKMVVEEGEGNPEVKDGFRGEAGGDVAMKGDGKYKEADE